MMTADVGLPDAVSRHTQNPILPIFVGVFSFFSHIQLNLLDKYFFQIWSNNQIIIHATRYFQIFWQLLEQATKCFVTFYSKTYVSLGLLQNLKRLFYFGVYHGIQFHSILCFILQSLQIDTDQETCRTASVSPNHKVQIKIFAVIPVKCKNDLKIAF